MATNVVDISTVIVTKLGGISGLNGIYNYEPDKPTSGQYPFATVTPTSFNGRFGDTQRNIRNYIFAVRVYQERAASGAGNAKAERLIREMIDEITTAFDMDTTLSGTVKMAVPIRGDLTYEPREVGDTRVCEIEIECMTVVNSA